MRFLFSWTGSYLKSAMAAAVIFTAAGALITFLRGGEITLGATGFMVFWAFVGIAAAAILPALILSAGPEIVGIGPNGFLFSLAGAGFALATLAGVTLTDLQDAKLLDSSTAELSAWLSATFDGVPRAQIGLFGFAGAAAGGALARSRARAISKSIRDVST